MRRIPGRTPYLNGTLRRGITANHDLRGCRQELIDGQVSRRTMTLTLLNEAATPVLRWRLSKAWIARWEGPRLGPLGNQVAIDSIERAHQGIRLD